MDLTLDEVASFVAIAGGSGFTAASRALHRSQPAISRRIRLLEGKLGAELFERVGRRVRLTPAGAAFLPHAEAALAALRDGVRTVSERCAASGAQSLRLAVVGSLADSGIVSVIRAARRRFRGAAIELRTANSQEVSALVRRGEAQLGLRYFPDPDPKLESLLLGVERLWVVVAPAHPLARRRSIALRALAEDAWLGFPADRRNPEASLERRLTAAGIARPKLSTVDSLTAQKRLAEAGLGVALLPESAFREELRQGRLCALRVRDPEPHQPVVLVRRRGGRETELSRAFVTLLRRSARAVLGAGSGRAS